MSYLQDPQESVPLKIAHHRKDRDEVYMDVAKLMAERSTCERLHVGAVLTKGNRIIATGYNGAPSGLKHCIDVGCEIFEGHCIRAVHAEASVISMCARYGISTENSYLYVTHFPCPYCAKLLINAGIIKVFYCYSYRDDKAAKILEEAGIKIFKVGE